MKKKILSLAMAVCMLLCMLPAGATAMEQGDARVTIGADLDAEERTKVYADFGIEPGDAIEITVTNADERAYLEGIAPEKKIGKVALSCTYIVIGEPGSGLQITTKHINWCTSEMYINALTTVMVLVMVVGMFIINGIQRFLKKREDRAVAAAENARLMQAKN